MKISPELRERLKREGRWRQAVEYREHLKAQGITDPDEILSRIQEAFQPLPSAEPSSTRCVERPSAGESRGLHPFWAEIVAFAEFVPELHYGKTECPENLIHRDGSDIIESVTFDCREFLKVGDDPQDFNYRWEVDAEVDDSGVLSAIFYRPCCKVVYKQPTSAVCDG